MQQQENQSVLVQQTSTNVPFAPVPQNGLTPLSDELLALVGGGGTTDGPHDNWR